MRVFLTGSSGFIGRHVGRHLASRGHQVIALTRFEAAAPSETLRNWDIGPDDGFLHLGWYAEPGKYIESAENIACLTQTIALTQSLIEQRVGQFVIAGTCLEYDTSRGWLVEDGPTAPESLYATTKLAASAVARRLAMGGGTRVATGRIFHLYGPGEDVRRVVPAAACALLAGRRFATSAGHQVRDFLHVEDVAAAFVTLLEQRAEGVFNVASGEPTTLRRLVGRVGELVGRPELIDFGAVALRPGEPECLCGSNAKLRSLGWQPRYGLDEGLRSYVEQLATDVRQGDGWRVTG